MEPGPNGVVVPDPNAGAAELLLNHTDGIEPDLNTGAVEPEPNAGGYEAKPDP